jgi:cytosine permease
MASASTSRSTGNLPAYVAAAKPVPRANRVPWYSSTAQTYAGVMLWFVFWQALVSGGGAGARGGVLAAGIGPALLGVVLAALICHFLFYLVPGLLGMRTGLPLYVVGTSTYGVVGGLFMPGLLMGLLQFGWLAVNAAAVAALLCKCFGVGLLANGDVAVPGIWHGGLAVLFAVLAAFVGLKGIQYLAKVATLGPLVPIVVLVLLFVNTAGGLKDFSPAKVIESDKAPVAAAAQNKAETEKTEGAAGAELEPKTERDPSAPLTAMGVIFLLSTYIVGFFATAGAAGTDISSNNRDARDVQLGGLTGIALATIFAGGLAILVVAGAYGAGLIPAGMAGNLNPLDLMKGTDKAPGLLGATTANIIMIALALSSFPPACFSAFIAANSFKTALPNVKPFLSVGFGTLVAILLAVTGLVDKVIFVFVVIGACFGPVCGAMAADYLLAGRKWAGPRAGFNPAGWISWIVGFAVGAVEFIAQIPGLESLQGKIPAPPVAAFVVGFVLYLVLAKAGLQSKSLKMPQTAS